MTMADIQCSTCKRRYRAIHKAIPMCVCQPRRAEPIQSVAAPSDMERFIAFGKAVDEEAVTTWTLNSRLTPKEQLQAIIGWHVRVAIDPAVNGGFELVKRSNDW